MPTPFDHDEDATPLTHEERQGLIPTHVTLRQELNELEESNILAANLWAFGRRRNVVQESFLRNIHKRMFNQVWQWAGDYRSTERNLGVAPYQIMPEVRLLLDDVVYWIEHQSYPIDEIAVRFHHRLVWIHPFPNGNGRWSRLAADLLIVALGGVRFTWGRSSRQAPSEVRRRYIEALKATDNHDPKALIAFARS